MFLKLKINKKAKKKQKILLRKKHQKLGLKTLIVFLNLSQKSKKANETQKLLMKTLRKFLILRINKKTKKK